MSSDEPKYPSMADIQKRILSFKKKWPLKTPKPSELAKCGFFYSNDTDEVTCYFCSVKIKDWLPNDDPVQKHTKLLPQCFYLKFHRKCSPKVNPTDNMTFKMEDNNIFFILNKLNDDFSKLCNVSNMQSKKCKEISTNDNNIYEKLCLICIEKERNSVFTPCGHLISCSNCADLLYKCPMCRKRIDNKIKIYNC